MLLSALLCDFSSSEDGLRQVSEGFKHVLLHDVLLHEVSIWLTPLGMAWWVLSNFMGWACMDSAPCSPSSPDPSRHFLIHGTTWSSIMCIYGGRCMEKKFLSIEPQQVRWTGLLTISEQMEQVSFLVTQVLGFGSSSSIGGGVIDFMYWITALGVSPLCLPLMFGFFEIMPSTLGELLKCKQIYKKIFMLEHFLQ